MQAKYAPIVIAVAIAFLILAIQFLLPIFESDQAKLERFVAPRVEQARQLLQNYNHNYQALAASHATLATAGLTLPQPPQPLQQAFVKNDALLADAASLLQEALRHQVGSARGADLYEPNTMLGLVLSRQADSLRLQALARRKQAQSIRWQGFELVAAARDALANARAHASADLEPAIQKLREQLTRVQQQAHQAQQQVDALQAEADALATKITPLREQAEQARAKLAQLQASPPDPADAAALGPYRQAYADASRAAQQAEYQADALQYGCLAGAQLDRAHGGDLVLDKYLDGTLQVGLNTIQARLDTTKAPAEAYSAAVTTLQNRLAQLEQHRSRLREQADAEQNLAQKTIGQLRTLLDEASRHAAEAETSENEAAARLEQAKRYLREAVKAAKARNQLASQQLSAGGQKRNPRLDVVANDRSREADAHKAFADAFVLQAELCLQRVTDLTEHRELLRETLELLKQQGDVGATTQPAPQAEAGATTRPGGAEEVTTGVAEAETDGGTTRPVGPVELTEAAGAAEIKLADSRKVGLESIDRPDSTDDAVGHLEDARRALAAMRAKDIWLVDVRAGQAWYVAAQLADDPQVRQDALAKAAAGVDAGLKASGAEAGAPETAPFAQFLAYLQKESNR